MGNQPLNKIELWVQPSGNKSDSVDQNYIPNTAILVVYRGDEIYVDLRKTIEQRDFEINVPHPIHGYGEGVEYHLSGTVHSVIEDYTKGEFVITIDVVCNTDCDLFTNFIEWLCS
jgi:hypothetical protein